MNDSNKYYMVQRGWQDRFDAVLDCVLRKYKRTYSLLDVGCNQGYFAKESMLYGAYPIGIEKDDHGAMPFPVVRSRVSGADLLELSFSEHFDVVLCLSTLHHVDDWQTFLLGLLSIGEHLIMEIPNPDDTECRHYERACLQHATLVSLGGSVLGTFRAHSGPGTRTMALYSRKKLGVLTGSFYGRMERKLPFKRKRHRVYANYSKKAFGAEQRPWIHGINLWSFLQLGGGEPARNAIAAGLPYSPGHGDIRPWNYILNHEGTFLFDPAPVGRPYHPDNKKAYEETLQWILQGGSIS